MFFFFLVGWGIFKVIRFLKFEFFGEIRYNGNVKGSFFKFYLCIVYLLFFIS